MIIWDDPKLDNYPYQTDFSYRMNHVSKRKWKIMSIIAGFFLGAMMAFILFVVPNTYFSDPTRMVVGIVLGGGSTKVFEARAERSTKIAQASMAITFAIGIGLYALYLLNR